MSRKYKYKATFDSSFFKGGYKEYCRRNLPKIKQQFPFLPKSQMMRKVKVRWDRMIKKDTRKQENSVVQEENSKYYF